MLKILTLNLNLTHDGFGPWPERRARLLALLEADRPQIVALQAVQVDADVDQAQELACALRYRDKLFMAADESHPHQGNAILSDIPLSAPWSFALPRDDEDEDPMARRAIGATFAWQGEVWQFTNAHCSWIKVQNLRQVEALGQALKAFPGPQCLVGDFNAPPEAPGTTHLARSAWLDTYAQIGRGQGPTFPADAPVTRIDYILLNEVDPKRILDVRVIPEGGAALSDHKGVLLTLGTRR